jgi:hypothetical protein
MILEEEYREAHEDAFPTCVLAVLSGAGSTFFAALIVAGATWATPPLAFALALTGFLARWSMRCRRVIRAWRDERRLELVQAEVDRLSGPRGRVP